MYSQIPLETSMSKPDLAGFLANASHVKRFKTLHIESDLEACLKFDSFEGIIEI